MEFYVDTPPEKLSPPLIFTCAYPCQPIFGETTRAIRKKLLIHYSDEFHIYFQDFLKISDVIAIVLELCMESQYDTETLFGINHGIKKIQISSYTVEHQLLIYGHLDAIVERETRYRTTLSMGMKWYNSGELKHSLTWSNIIKI